MKSSLSVSVITPSFNQGAFLATTLQSVAGQSYPHREHIVVDPGSTDESLTIIRQWLSEGNNRRALVGLDKSQMNAINIGVENAKGDILCWLNSDDGYFDERVLEEVAGIFSKEPGVDVVYGRGWFVDPSGAKLKDAYINVDDRDLEASFLTSIGMLQPATFIRKEAWLRAGPVDESMQFSFDYEFWVRLLKTGSVFRFLDRNLAKAIIHTDAKTMAGRLQSLEECVQTAVRHYGFAPKEWLQRLADKELNDNDGILKSSGENNHALLVATEQKFLMRNADNTSAGRLLSLAHIKQATGSLASWRGNRVAPLHIVTCFDAPYFHSGLTLLSQLCRHGHADTPKYVFDLGLTPEQRSFLERLKNTYVVSFDPYRKSYEDWYFDPKSYVYKILALQHMKHIARAGEIVLWIDAGVAPIADLRPVVEILERDGVFFVDHDDRPGWPFYNIVNTSDAFIQRVKPSLKEMLAPHLCSCLMGYKRGHRCEEIFAEAFALSAHADVSLGDKHPPAPYQKLSPSSAESKSFRSQWHLSGEGALAKLGDLRRLFGYWGHRQDQSILSYLAAKHDATLQSTTRFCLGSDNSSKLSKENWDCKGFSKSLVPQVGLFEQYAPAVTAHHRGSVISYDDLSLRPPKSDDLIIFGTYAGSEAVEKLSMAPCHTMALNLGYRRWLGTGRSPDFFACSTSPKVLAECRQSITEYIRGQVERGAETLFVVGDALLDELSGKSRARCLNMEALMRGLSRAANVTDPFVRLLIFCQLLGYKGIHLVGFDHLFAAGSDNKLLEAVRHACLENALDCSNRRTIVFHRGEALRRNGYRVEEVSVQDAYTTANQLSRSAVQKNGLAAASPTLKRILSKTPPRHGLVQGHKSRPEAKSDAASFAPSIPQVIASPQFCPMAAGQWTLSHDPDAKQQMLAAVFRGIETKEQKYIAVIGLLSDQKITARISLGRFGDAPFEGVGKQAVLMPGQAADFVLAHSFNSVHPGLKVQLEVQTCSGPEALIRIEHCAILPSVRSAIRNVKNNGNVVASANRFFREGRYAESIPLYAAGSNRLQQPSLLFSAKLALRRLGIQDEAVCEKVLAEFV
jgi:glycosyltransferase involved in cell wall biosynthesis